MVIDPTAVASALEKLRQHPEPEVGLMRTTNGIIPAYNVQAAVDVEHALMVVQQVIDQATDNRSLQPMAEAAIGEPAQLAYANEHRPWQLYQKVFGILFARCQQAAGTRHGFRFRNPLLSIDGTIIELCATMFDWAKYQQTKGAAKLHLVLDHDGHLPCYAVITEGKASEVKVAREFQFAPGTILVFDRG